MTGPTGPTGTVASAYAYVYSTSTQTVLNGGAILFGSNGQLLNITHTAGSSTLTISNTGIYAVTFSAIVSGLGTDEWAIEINGSAAAGTNYYSSVQGFGQAILSITGGSTLQIVNVSGASSFVTGTVNSTVSASVLVVRLQ